MRKKKGRSGQMAIKIDLEKATGGRNTLLVSKDGNRGLVYPLA